MALQLRYLQTLLEIGSTNATTMGKAPGALQLRYLQTLREIGAEQNSTIVFPLPIDLIKPLLGAAAETTEGEERTGELEPGPGPEELPRVAFTASHLDSPAHAEP